MVILLQEQAVSRTENPAAIFCNLQDCHLLQLAFNGALKILLPVQLHMKSFARQ